MRSPNSSISSGAVPVGSHVPSRTARPLLFLEICRGRTSFPRRPVTADRFLIGSGPQCHLRLGGENIPVVHSILFHDGRDFWIDLFAPSPVLKLNAEAVHCERIEDGDRIEIGAIEFVARGQTTVSSPVNWQDGEKASTICEEIPDREPQDLSAAELVQAIEQQEALVREFESGRQTGLDALMEAVQDRMETAEEPEEETPQPCIVGFPEPLATFEKTDSPRHSVPDLASPDELRQTLEETLAQLQRIGEVLRDQSPDETGDGGVLREILDQQTELIGQWHGWLQQHATWQANEAESRRASA